MYASVCAIAYPLFLALLAFEPISCHLSACVRKCVSRPQVDILVVLVTTNNCAQDFSLKNVVPNKTLENRMSRAH